MDPTVWPGNWADAEPAGGVDGLDSNCDGEDGFTLQDAIVTITGPRYFGHSVLADVDLNGDGLDDLVALGPSNVDAVQVFWGDGLLGGGILDSTDADVVIEGEWGRGLDKSAERSVLGSMGDVDGDGLDDFAVCTHNGNGAAYFVTGAEVVGGLASLELAGGFIEGAPALGGFGHTLSTGGDLDGDGLRDLVVGAPGSDLAGVDFGAVFVFAGVSLATGVVDASEADHVIEGTS